jgi:hypothetical protein
MVSFDLEFMGLLKYERVVWLNISREGAKARRNIEGVAAWVNVFSSDGGALTIGKESLGYILEFSSSRLRVKTFWLPLFTNAARSALKI